MTTKIRLYNKALGFLGTRRLDASTGLTEDVEQRYALDAVYDDALQSCLEMGNWKFALRTRLYEPDTGITPSFGLAYVYPIPSDFVRLAGISTDERFKLEIADYVEENGYWFSDQPEIYIRYVSNDTSYGLDVGLYPENYSRVVACHMAIESSLPITKSRGDRNDLLAEFQNIILPRAKRFDALDEPVKKRPSGTWVAARFRSMPRSTYVRNGKIGGF